MRLPSYLLPLVVLGLVTSCSSTSKRSISDPYGTEDKFCTEWAKAACTNSVVEKCSGDTASKTTIAACQSSQKSYCLGLIPPNYASTNAKGCIAAVGKAYSDGKLTSDELGLLRKPLAAPCDKLNKGPNSLGESCTSDDQCNSLEDQRCVIPQGTSSGTCQVPVEVGGGLSCGGADQVCATGFYCDGSHCIAKKSGGESCDVDTPCAEDFQCLGATGNMSCQAKSDNGGTCTADEQCKSSICAIAGAGSGTCVPSVILAPTEPLCTHLR